MYMSEAADEQYTPSGVFARNYGDLMRLIGGGWGFTTLYLIYPERDDGPPVTSKLPSDCTEANRQMLTRLYSSMGITGPETYTQFGEQEAFRVEAEPNPIAANSPMASVRSN
jgi:hypothetical protein